ncbi:MAG: hypothetical protein AAF393_14260 [Pseudomonadota bacterium]
MNLTELTTIPVATLPVDLLKQHLRVGTGFPAGQEQDELLEAYLRSAISAVEGRTGIILIEREFSWEVTRWRQQERQELPIRPVTAITAVTLLYASGVTEAQDVGRFTTVVDHQASTIAAASGGLPAIPALGSAIVTVTAGYGADWSDVPEDLARAVLIIAANYYTHRDGNSDAGLPSAAAALIERYRAIRLGAAR